MIELLNKLETDGTLKRLLDAGFISYKVCFHKQLYEHWNRNVIGGMKSNEAALSTSVEFNITKGTVWKAIKSMQQK